MARPSKLSEKQLNEATERIALGESIRAIAKEYGVSEGALRARVSTQANTVKNVAQLMLDAEIEFKQLPVSTRVITHNVLDKLRSITEDITSSAAKGASISNRLAAIAEKHLSFAETASYDENIDMVIENVKTVNAIMRTANESSALAVDLLKANKEAVDSMSKPQEEKQKTLQDFYRV